MDVDYVDEVVTTTETCTSSSHCPHCHNPGLCPSWKDQSSQTNVTFQHRPPDADVCPVSNFSEAQSSKTTDAVCCDHKSELDAEEQSEAEGDDFSDNDPTYRPPIRTGSDSDDHEQESDSEDDDAATSPVTDRKYIVHDRQLDHLFRRCQECGAHVMTVTKKEHGSLLSVETTCAADHIVVWHSQPTHGRGYTLGGCGTWLIAAAILFCGGSFQTFALFATLLNLAIVGERSYVFRHAKVAAVSSSAQGLARPCGIDQRILSW